MRGKRERDLSLEEDAEEDNGAEEQDEPGPVHHVRAARLLLVAALVAVGALVVVPQQAEEDPGGLLVVRRRSRRALRGLGRLRHRRRLLLDLLRLPKLLVAASAAVAVLVVIVIVRVWARGRVQYDHGRRGHVPESARAFTVTDVSTEKVKAGYLRRKHKTLAKRGAPPCLNVVCCAVVDRLKG